MTRSTTIRLLVDRDRRNKNKTCFTIRTQVIQNKIAKEFKSYSSEVKTSLGGSVNTDLQRFSSDLMMETLGIFFTSHFQKMVHNTLIIYIILTNQACMH